MAPPLVKIPAGMIKDTAALSACNLSVLPNEVLLKIINQQTLTVFDQACFMLTCKGAARMVGSSNANLSISKIAHGMEESAIEWETAMQFNCDLCEYRKGSSPDCACGRRSHELENVLIKRTPEKEVERFFKRLDNGWNRSETRFCADCGLFQSTNAEHWSRKAEYFQYKRCGRLARFWRIGHYQFVEDIEYCENANAYVKEWLSEGVKGTLKCPECKVIERSSRCMECMYNMSINKFQVGKEIAEAGLVKQ